MNRHQTATAPAFAALSERARRQIAKSGPCDGADGCGGAPGQPCEPYCYGSLGAEDVPVEDAAVDAPGRR